MNLRFGFKIGEKSVIKYGSVTIFLAFSLFIVYFLQTQTKAFPDPENVNVTIFDDGFEVRVNWKIEPQDTWRIKTDIVHSGTYSAGLDSNSSTVDLIGNLTSKVVDTSNIQKLYVDLWFYDDDLDTGDFLIFFNDSSGNFDQIADISGFTEDTWNNWITSTTDTQYFHPGFSVRIYCRAKGANAAERCRVDDVKIIKEVPLGWLNVTLLSPTPNQETNWIQYSSYWINATITCEGPIGAVCGRVTGTMRYNASTALPDTPISTAFGATPFHNVPINYSTGNYSYDYWNFSVAAQDGNPSGIKFNGTYFWIVGYANDRIYRYLANGTYDNWQVSVDGTYSASPNGLEFNGTHFFVTDGSDDLVYAFFENGTYTGWSFSTANQIDLPTGIAFNGTYFWIGDFGGDFRVYRYFANGTYTGHSFVTVPSLTDGAVEGLEYYNGYLYVTTFNDVIYRHRAEDGAYDNWYLNVSAQETDLLSVAFNGTYFWIVGENTDKVYRYSEVIGQTDNPMPCNQPILNKGESCQLNWIVNATGSIGEAYKIDVNFTSSYSQIGWNDTHDAVVKITSGAPVYGSLIIDLTDPNPLIYTASNPKQVGQNSTFIVNATVQCINGNCGSVNATLYYNSTGITNATVPTVYDPAKPFYVIYEGNPIQLGTMNQGDFKFANFTVNATGPIGEIHYFYVNFTSSDANVQFNVSNISYVNITTAECQVAIGLSLWLSEQVNFTGDPGQTVDAFGNNGEGVTNYNVSVSITGCTPNTVNVYIKANADLTSNGNIIPLANMKFRNSTTDNTVPSTLQNISLTTSYQTIGSSLIDGSYIYLKFLLIIPTGTVAGVYNNTVFIKGTRSDIPP